MSKGLEALENIKILLENKYGLLNYIDYLDTIKLALKRLEQLEEEKQSFDRQLEKKLKALEIIKKYVAIDELIDDGELFMYSIRDKQYISSRSCLVMTDEEYKLLKEVLL